PSMPHRGGERKAPPGLTVSAAGGVRWGWSGAAHSRPPSPPGRGHRAAAGRVPRGAALPRVLSPVAAAGGRPPLLARVSAHPPHGGYPLPRTPTGGSGTFCSFADGRRSLTPFLLHLLIGDRRHFTWNFTPGASTLPVHTPRSLNCLPSSLLT